LGIYLHLKGKQANPKIAAKMQYFSLFSQIFRDFAFRLFAANPSSRRKSQKNPLF